MFRLVVLFCFLALGQSKRFLPKPIPDGRIVGGIKVDITEVPHVVSLEYHTSLFCGGSLISKNYVLTAAHCTYGTFAGSMKVRIGSSKYESGGILVPVKKINHHPKYHHGSADYDFSILELESYDNNGLIWGPAKLPKQGQDVADGTPLVVYGWGRTLNPKEPRDNLRATYVPKANQQSCNSSYARYGGVTDRMICAGLPQGGKDACDDDSGGPLMENDTLVGVVSYFFGCGFQNYPSIYSRVASVLDWIKSVSGV